MIFYTSITSNYIPKARILARSVKKHVPGATFVLLLADRLPAGFPESDEPFDLIWKPEDLGLPVPNVDAWIFSHTVVELCTAVKGQAILRMFDQLHADKVIYLDPDIVVLDDLSELIARFEDKSILLTPHLVEPETTYEGILDNEVCALQHGIFNLGFVGVKNSPEGRRFATWWRDRLIDFCYDDIPRGIFTDQRWADFVPAFFEDVAILRDKQYNVATWNLNHRKVEANEQGKLFIEGKPIRFYHFSGFDSGAQEAMLKKYGQENEGLYNLRRWYIEEMDHCGQGNWGKIPCVYGFYSDGTAVTKEQRVLYRNRPDLQATFPKPLDLSPGSPNFVAWFNADKKEREAQKRKAEKQSFKAAFKERSPRLFNLLKQVKNGALLRPSHS